MRIKGFLAAGILIAGAGGAAADSVSDFYKANDIRFIIRSGVGGGYDQYARLLGRHIGRHIPGNPNVIPVNMPGGGGILAANYVAMKAPRDGSILTIASQGLPMDQALGLNKSLQGDMREFNWIGNLSNSNQVLVVWHTSKTKSFDDLLKQETTIGATGAGSVSVQMPAFLNNMLGTKIKLVFGYPAGTDINVAMERGEVEGRSTNPWASYKAVTPQYISNKQIIPILQMGLAKEPDLPDVPLLRDLAKTPDEKLVLDFISKSIAVGRPIATTPGAPPERVAALRKAFDDTLKDPVFMAEANKQRAEINAMTGAELAQIIKDIIEAPQATRDKAKSAMTTPKDFKEVESKKN